MLHGGLSQLAFGLILALTSAQIQDLEQIQISVIDSIPGRADPNFVQPGALPQRLQDANLSSNEIFEVLGARGGAGQTNEFAGLLTGVPGDDSTDDLYQQNDTLFRPFCFTDLDCDSGNCEVVDPLDADDPNRQFLLVQGLEGTFYCGPPGQGNSDQETCETLAAREANQPDSPDDLENASPDDFRFQRVDGICTNVASEERFHFGGNQNLQRRPYAGVPLDIEEERSSAPESITPRLITDEVCEEPGDIPNQFGTSTLLAYCGQFIDHDLTLIEFQPEDTRITIEGSGVTGDEIVFELSVLAPGSFPGMFPNSATAFIDLSMVYGNSLSVAFSLRKPGYMAALDFSIFTISGEDQMFLPLASQIQGDLSSAPDPDPDNFQRFVPTAMHPTVANLFSGGDLRANEQVMLVSWHTLFLREHNRLLNDAVQPNTGLECEPETDEQRALLQVPDGCELLYQLTRRVNIAQWQQIVFVEYFSSWHEDNPATRNGPNNIVTQYLANGGYDPEVNPDIDIYFSSGGYRFGHTIVRTYVVDKGPAVDDTFRSVFLGNAFFNSAEVTRSDRFGTSGFLFGASQQCGASLDQFISNGIRSFLFGNIPDSEFRNSDLMAFNIERCRDHACPLYNDIQRFYEYDTVDSYEELVSRNAGPNFEIPECYVDALERVFGPDDEGIDSVDPMVAMLIEPATIGQSGITQFTVIRDQFIRIMAGDSFFFLHEDGPAPAQITAAGFSIDQIENTNIADILNRNSFNGKEVVIDSLTGALADAPDGTADVFSENAFIAPTNTEGECCVSNGESAPTPVCMRNSTNPYSFYREDVSRCEALSALILQGASNGAVGGFIAGTMLPITFTSYNCQCNRYVDEEVTIVATLLTQSLSNEEIIAQLQADIALLTSQPMDGIGGVASRVPAENIQVQPLGSNGETRVVVVMGSSPDPDTFSDTNIMFGDMNNYEQNEDTVLMNSANVVSLECMGCQPLPSDFIQETAVGAEQEALLLGLPVAIGGAIIGGVALVVLILVGCGVRMYMNKRSQTQMFTSGQESV